MPTSVPARPHRREAPWHEAPSTAAILLFLLMPVLVPGSSLNAQSRYVAFGDSITAGVGAEDDRGYPPRLEEMLQENNPGTTVENQGVPGETTVEGLTRIEEVLEAGQGTILLMEGTNDVSQSISSETIVFNLEEIARKTESAGWEIVHATVIPRRPDSSSPRKLQINGNLNRALRASVGARGLELADPFEVFGSTPDRFDRLYSDDPNDRVGHPNGEGYELMAEVFRDVILGVDSVPPVPSFLRPEPGADEVPPDTTIEVEIRDFGAGIDLSETELRLEGREVPSEVSGDSDHVRLVYRPSEPLSGRVSVELLSRDLASPPNRVDREVSSFLIEGAELLQGDLDGSHRVDGADLVLFALRFGTRRGDPGFDADADFNDDGAIEGEDLAILAANFGQSD
ncbi:MAG: GDSL-type esterase/lipase family protein [Thermoanaerobaculia bacterium]|nr:GDSL-type esterase/lipase family protein [Thermoanaerobaculia bacterium]